MKVVVSFLGVLLSLVMLGVSGGMNYMFMSSLGKTPIEGYIFGGASAAADGLKALLPFFILWAYMAGRWLVASSGTFVWLFFTAFSLLSAFGFSAQNRGAVTQSKESLAYSYNLAETELNELLTQVKDLAKSRPVGTLEQAIKQQRQNKRWNSSKQCTDATAKKSRSFCEQYFTLKAELETAVAKSRKRPKISSLRTELKRLKKQGAGKDTDPQVSLLSNLFGQEKDKVRMALIVMAALLVEIGSGLGLFLSTSHSELLSGRKAKKAHKGSSSHAFENVDKSRLGQGAKVEILPPAITDQSMEISPVGDVLDYCLARIQMSPSDDDKAAIEHLYGDYQSWCEGERSAPVPENTFAIVFDNVAGQSGINKYKSDYLGIILGNA